MSRTSDGRGWAYAGTALGGFISIATNIGHSYVPAPDAPTGWHPPLGEIVLAACWPVLLFVAIEVLARTRWRQGALWFLVRYAGLIPVAGTAAVVSYLHLSGLLAHYGEPHITVVIGPLAVDGLMTMSAAAILSTSPRRVETAPETAPEPVHPEPPKTPAEQPENRTPKPRARTAKKSTRKSAPKRRTDEELLAEASALNEAALASGGEPVSKRALKTALRVGQPTADRLHAAVVVTASEAAPEYAIEHANGRELAALTEGN